MKLLELLLSPQLLDASDGNLELLSSFVPFVRIASFAPNPEDFARCLAGHYWTTASVVVELVLQFLLRCGTIRQR